MQRNYLFVFLVLVCMISCSRSAKYPGFKPAGDAMYYRLHKIGENPEKAKPGDYITVNLEYRTINDSLFFAGTRKLKVSNPADEGSIDACFTLLAEEDSASFILLAEDFFINTLRTDLPAFIPAGGSLKINVEMLDIQTEAEYENEKEAFLSWIDDFGD